MRPVSSYVVTDRFLMTVLRTREVATRRHLRSAARHQLTVPRHRLSTYGRRAFAVAGPMMFVTLCQMIYAILQSAHRPSDSR